MAGPKGSISSGASLPEDGNRAIPKHCACLKNQDDGHSTKKVDC